VALLFAVGAGIDLWFYLETGEPLALPIFGLAGLVAGSGIACVSYLGGPRAVLWSTGARRVEDDPQDMNERRFRNIVEEMAVASGLPRPAAYVVDDPDPNAFATGRGPETAAIAATRGLLDALDREELTAVVAHEMAHIRNYDVRLMTIVAALGGAIVLLADAVGRGIFRSGGRRSGGGKKDAGALIVVLFVVWLVLIVLAPILVRLLALAVSRTREYLADATAAELTRNPGALASALGKIEAAVEPTLSIKSGVAHLCIADPLGRKANERDESGWTNLWATHPPIRKRIEALRAMAGNPAQSPAS
jgi:heat shock protein HtpX